ncbi:hypothetical protein BGX28_007810 [Mortierella sp. GBA30]|nr:hypothetical protein BGX28_007810 [Mortierella sp. GBA30]
MTGRGTVAVLDGARGDERPHIKTDIVISETYVSMFKTELNLIRVHISQTKRRREFAGDSSTSADQSDTIQTMETSAPLYDAAATGNTPPTTPTVIRQQRRLSQTQLVMMLLQKRYLNRIGNVDISAFPATFHYSTIQPWSINESSDEQLLLEFLERLPKPGIKIFASSSFPFHNRRLLRLLTLMHMHESASLSMVNNTAHTSSSYDAGVRRFLERCPSRLRTLRIAVTVPVTPDDLGMEPVIHPDTDIHGIRRKVQHADNADDDDMDEKFNAGTMNNKTAIEHLFLEGNIALAVHQGFLTRCSGLRSLSLSISTVLPSPELIHSLQQHCPLLEDLALSSTGQFVVNMSQSVANLLTVWSDPQPNPSAITAKRFLGLKRLRLEGLPLQTPKIIFQAIYHYSQTLTHLAFRDCVDTLASTFDPQPTINPNTLLHILRSFKYLEEVDVMSRSSSFHWFALQLNVMNGRLDARKFVESSWGTMDVGEWACAKTLKVLRVEINGFDRGLLPTSLEAAGPPSQNSQDGVDIDSEESYHLQRQVCLVLGALTSLQELCFGDMNVPGGDELFLPAMKRSQEMLGSQATCLDLSLESCLELLSGMKEMRILKVGGMDHRIGLSEIQWMCEYWPKLEAVYGLLRVRNRERSDAHWTGSADEKANEAELVQWIRKNRPQLQYS